MRTGATNRCIQGVFTRLLPLFCALWLAACATSPREPRVMMPTQPQSYIRTYPPSQQGQVPTPASRRYTQAAPSQRQRSLLYPQAAPLNVETANPRRPVIYPQGSEGPGLRMIQHQAPAIPAWARQAEDAQGPAHSAHSPRTPMPYVEPEYAPRQLPTAPSRSPAAPYTQPTPKLPPSVYERAPSTQSYGNVAPSQTFEPPAQRFDARVSGGSSRYEIQGDTESSSSRARWWLGETEPAENPSAPTAASVPPAPRAASPSASYSAPRSASPLPPLDLPPLAASTGGAAYVGGASRGIILGAGDVITINVLGRPELTATVDVTGSGSINVPLAGDVPVAGLSTSEAATRVEEALRRGEFVINPQVTLTTLETRSQQVSVLGEVNQPGRFKIETRTTVMDGLAQAGGISPTGMNFAYILRREGGVVARYEMDIDALVEAGAGQQYFELQPGDTVIVPKADLFYIYGEVRTPNSYRLKPGMGVIQALSLAGGLTDKGSDRRIEIRRRGADGGLHTFGVNLSDPIYPDDVIYVKERFF